MPTYEYACTSCGEHLEVVQSFTDESLSTCSNCGGNLRKVFGSIGIVLKGSGFYKTDNRKGSAAKAGSSTGESSSGSSGESSSGSSGESSGSGSSGGESTSSSGTNSTSTSASSSGNSANGSGASATPRAASA